MSKKSYKISSKNFTSMINIFKTMSTSNQNCDNLILVNGVLRQFFSGAYIYNIDFTSIVPGFAEIDELILNNLSMKTKLLEPFKRQEMDVDLVIDEHTLSFQDKYSSISFTKPDKKSIGNLKYYISKEELDSKVNINKDREILSFKMEKFILDRINTYKRYMEASKINIRFEDGKTHFELKVTDNMSSATTTKFIEIDQNEDINLKGLAYFDVSPFLFSTYEFDMKIYERASGDNIIICELSTMVDDIPVQIFMFSKLLEL